MSDPLLDFYDFLDISDAGEFRTIYHSFLAPRRMRVTEYLAEPKGFILPPRLTLTIWPNVSNLKGGLFEIDEEPIVSAVPFDDLRSVEYDLVEYASKELLGRWRRGRTGFLPLDEFVAAQPAAIRPALAQRLAS